MFVWEKSDFVGQRKCCDAERIECVSSQNESRKSKIFGKLLVNKTNIF